MIMEWNQTQEQCMMRFHSPSPKVLRTGKSIDRGSIFIVMGLKRKKRERGIKDFTLPAHVGENVLTWEIVMETVTVVHCKLRLMSPDTQTHINYNMRERHHTIRAKAKSTKYTQNMRQDGSKLHWRVSFYFFLSKNILLFTVHDY